MRKVTINFFKTSYEAMGDIYPEIGAQAAIRALVHQHVAKVRAARVRLPEEVSIRDLDIEESE